MKTRLNHAALLMLVFTASCSSLKTAPDIIKDVTHKVRTKDFTIKVNYANPMRGRQIYLTSQYDLRIHNDSAFAYLPYFGVATSAPYGGGEGGIKFAELVQNYSMRSNKKSNGWDIRFKIRAKEYDYEIYLNIFNNGSSVFTVNSYNRDVITFNGEIKR